MALQELIYTQMTRAMASQHIPEPVAQKIIEQLRVLQRDWRSSSWANAQAIIVAIMEVIESCSDLPGPQKKQLALALLQCIDPNMNTEDASVFIDVIATASKGILAINKSCKCFPCF
jgi:hypothetical protein